jgi:hypothetical protein
MNTQLNGMSRSRSLKGLAIALLIAAVVLVIVVLPAERAFDPTGIGSVLGLTSMNRQRGNSANAVVEDVTGGNDVLGASAKGGLEEPMILPNPAIHQDEATPPRTDTIKVTLKPDQKTEIKAVLGKAKAMVYSWTVEGGKVYVDFHGHDPSRGESYWVRYKESDEVTGNSGSLVAPFAGEHGWYWMNVSDRPVTISLTVTGYQQKLIDYGLLQ